MNTQQSQRKQRAFRRRLIIAVIMAIFIACIIIIWSIVGGVLVTILSALFTGLGLIVGIFQWLLPVDAEGPVTHQHENTTQRRDIQQEPQEMSGTLSTVEGPPFDEALLSRPDQFVGREDDLQWVLRRLRRGKGAGTTVLQGMGGIGKTTLAAVAVHRIHMENNFPDGIVVIICQELTDPVEIVWRILTRFDTQYSQLQNRSSGALADITRRVLKEKQALVVLDNIEPGLAVEQVISPLRAAGIPLLVTARQTLPITVAPIEATRKLELLRPEDAREIFIQSLGHRPSSNERIAIDRIVTALGRHTLAIKLIGAYAAACHRDLRTLADELNDPQRVIKGFSGDTPQAMIQVFAKSVEALPLDGQYLFTALAAFPTSEFGRLATLALATSLGFGHPEHCADQLVRWALLDASTIETAPAACDHERLRLHPLVRAFASHLLSNWSEKERESCIHAIAFYYADYVNKAPEVGLGIDEDNILGALEWAEKQSQDTLVISICAGMRRFWHDHGRAAASLRFLPQATEFAGAIADHSQKREDRMLTADFALSYGQVLELTGRPDDAERTFKQNLIIRQDLGDQRGEGEVLRYLGRLAQVREHLEEAEDYYQQALLLARQVQNLQEESEVLRALGEVAQVRGHLDETERYYQQALAIARRVGDRREEGGVLRSLGELFWWLGQEKDAKEHFQLALTIAYEVQNRREVGWLLASLGGLALRAGQLEEAEEDFLQALTIDREVQNRNEEGWALFSLGKLAQVRGMQQEATEYYQQSLSIAREVQNLRDEPELLCSLGDVAAWTGKLQAAEEYYQQALTIAYEVHHQRSIGRVLRSMGQFQQARGRLVEAEEAFQQARTIDQAVHDQREMAEILYLLGDVARWRGQLETAEDYYKQSMTIFRAVHNRRGEGKLLLARGEMARAQGNMKTCQDLFQQSLQIAREVRSRSDEGEVLRILGELALLQRRPRAADGYLTQALEISREVQNKREEAQSLSALGGLALRKGQIEVALRYYHDGITLLRTIDDPFHEARSAFTLAPLFIEHPLTRSEGCQMLRDAIRLFAQMHLPLEQQARQEFRRSGCQEEQ